MLRLPLRSILTIVYNRRFVQLANTTLTRKNAVLDLSNHSSGAAPTVYWRVEGSLLDLTVVRPVAFFTWNAQTFTDRFRRRMDGKSVRVDGKLIDTD